MNTWIRLNIVIIDKIKQELKKDKKLIIIENRNHKRYTIHYSKEYIIKNLKKIENTLYIL